MRRRDRKALEWIAKNGGGTLESLIAKRNIKMPDWDITNPDVIKAWEQVSVDFANGAKGHIRVLQGDSLRVSAIFGKEFQALKLNPNVKSITSINPDTGEEFLLWAR